MWPGREGATQRRNGNEEFIWRTAKLARNTDPHTSHEAAASQSADKIRESQAAILEVLREHGPTADFLIYEYVTGTGVKISPSGCRTRRKELVDRRLVRDSGKRNTTASGRKTIIWEAVS